jgi:hypothetical protein
MGMAVLRDAHPLTKRLYTKRLVPRVARGARLLITNSEYSKWEIVRHLGIPEDRIRVTPLAASADFKPTVPRKTEMPYFLYVGNLEPRKNLERLIEAFAEMPRRDHQLIIAGNRWYRGGDAEQKARSMGLNGRVKFLGYVPRGDLPALFSGATAFVYPSLLEGFGMPIVEAMSCGAPVITSDNSSMKEVGGNAAMLVDPLNVREMTEALSHVADDSAYREGLSCKGLARAAEFSWEKTASLTLDIYREAMDGKPRAAVRPRRETLGLMRAIHKTIDYAKLFQYPLTPDELRERLFDVAVDEPSFRAALKTIQYKPDRGLVAIRTEREKISDRAIAEINPYLRTLASLPFVRMIAFSGSTAHRNMTSTEDVDLFMIVEDGKVWAVFLVAILWSRLRGVRRQLCMNYLLSDAALPLLDLDSFTAQQVASLKPLYGKTMYDRFLAANPFVKRCFPNFDKRRHRDAYPEIKPRLPKRLIEALLRLGPIQSLDRLSRLLLGGHLTNKIGHDSDVVLEPGRLKLHLHSHKVAALSSVASNTASSSLAPAAQRRHQENVEVQD